MTIGPAVGGHVLPAPQGHGASTPQPRRSSAPALAIALARSLQWGSPMKQVARSEVRLVDLKVIWFEVEGRGFSETAKGVASGFVLFGLPGSGLLVLACSLVNLAFGRGAF